MKKLGILAILGSLLLATGCNMNQSQEKNGMNGKDRESQSYWNQQNQKGQDGERMQSPTPQPRQPRRCNDGCNTGC